MPRRARSAVRAVPVDAVGYICRRCGLSLGRFLLMDAAHVSESGNSTTAGGSLLSAGFLGLLATQFLTALNDNIYRWLIIGIGKDHVAAYTKAHGESGWLNDGNVLMA